MNILLKKTVIENAKMKFRILMQCTFIFSIEQVSVLSAECDCSVFFRRQLHKCILLVLYIAICLYFFVFIARLLDDNVLHVQNSLFKRRFFFKTRRIGNSFFL